MAAYVAKTAREMADADLRSEFSRSHVNDLRFKQVFANLINNAVTFSGVTFGLPTCPFVSLIKGSAFGDFWQASLDMNLFFAFLPVRFASQ